MSFLWGILHPWGPGWGFPLWGPFWGILPMGRGGGEILPIKVGLGGRVSPYRGPWEGPCPAGLGCRGAPIGNMGPAPRPKTSRSSAWPGGVWQQQLAVAHTGKVQRGWVSRVTLLTSPHRCPPPPAPPIPGNCCWGCPQL